MLEGAAGAPSRAVPLHCCPRVAIVVVVVVGWGMAGVAEGR